MSILPWCRSPADPTPAFPTPVISLGLVPRHDQYCDGDEPPVHLPPFYENRGCAKFKNNENMTRELSRALFGRSRIELTFRPPSLSAARRADRYQGVGDTIVQ